RTSRSRGPRLPTRFHSGESMPGSVRTDKTDGKVIQTLSRIVSEDGKTMIVRADGMNAQGQPVESVAVWESNRPQGANFELVIKLRTAKALGRPPIHCCCGRTARSSSSSAGATRRDALRRALGLLLGASVLRRARRPARRRVGRLDAASDYESRAATSWDGSVRPGTVSAA